MNQLDVYYRALADYRQNTVADNNCSALRAAIAEADAEQDKIETTRVLCSIDEDWVEAIEAGLIHIEKAIKEERQFIRSNGEVIPIEKVKHVSKESVEHLAKHSNLISRYEEDEDIIPDNLFTVERLNDYTVYENRFLYMLLCYLRDFITIRYNDILELTNRYEVTVDIDKKIVRGKQKISYKLSMQETRRDDPYLRASNPAKEVIDRISLILKTVLAFLATPLMEEVSKVAMIKPPITKTNVLKMNNNFKGAVALYDFIIAYDKKGYTVEEKKNTLSPFKDDLADEFAEAGSLVSFLAYEYGLGIKQELKDSYEREEGRRKAEAIKQRDERIEALKKKFEKTGIGIEEYVLELEAQLRELRGESERAEAIADKLMEEKSANKLLGDKILSLNYDIERLNSTLTEIEEKHFDELRTLNQEHEAEVSAIEQRHSAEVAKMRDEQRTAEEKHAAELTSIRKEASDKVAQIRSESAAAVNEAKKESERCRTELAETQSSYDALLEEKRVADARIKALGGIAEDYTDRESFNELEKEYNAFTKIYNQQWEKTKKQIKKNNLNFKNLRGQKEKKGKEKKNDSESD